jgi:hypothetical protein
MRGRTLTRTTSWAWGTSVADSKVLKSAEKRRPPNAGKGRVKGVQNKLTRTVKEAVQAAFDSLQKHKKANLEEWAKENTTEFYKLAAKLIPAAIDAKVSGTVVLSSRNRLDDDI